MTNSIRALLASGFVALIAAPAAAVTIDFSEFVHGQEVTESQGVYIYTRNIGGGPDLGVAFDTNATGTSDRDLEFGSGWTGGNLAPDTDLGNIMIIQENWGGCQEESGVIVCNDPDDEGSRPAGMIAFDYYSLGSFTHFEMDLIDVENPAVGYEPGSIDFYLGVVHVEHVMFSDFTSPEVGYGDNTANHLNVLDGIEFDLVVISLGGSGGIDNLVATNAIPEPSAALLFFAGMAVVQTRLRRSN